MLCGLEEKWLSNKFNVKVRPHQGANIDDTYDTETHIYVNNRNISLYTSLLTMSQLKIKHRT